MQTPLLLAFLRFEHPGYLVLLATLPLIVALSFRSLAGLGAVRRWLAIGLRCLVILAIVLALAGAQRTQPTDQLAVIFLLDRSASVPSAQRQQGFEFIKDSRAALRPTKDRMGIIAFDGEPAVEQLPMGDLGIKSLGEPVRPDQTDISDALGMAMALFTDDAARRVVLLSDGNENVGHALEEADQFGAAGVPIDVVPLRYQHGAEVVFERLSAPPTANADETIDLQMVLRATEETKGKIFLYHNDQLVDLDPGGPGAGYPVVLEPGPNRFRQQLPMRSAGAHRFKAVFEPDDKNKDMLSANNEGRAFTIVSGQGKILILAQSDSRDDVDGRAALLLARALEMEKLDAEVQVAGATPLDQVRLLEYSLVILSNVPASMINDDERKALATYVRDLGGGLVMVGGPDSFGAGGWMDTPVEEVMPVSFDVKNEKQIPKGALVLVMHACEVPQGNYWGERCAIAAVKTLSSRDLIGVLCYQWQGAAEKYWHIPLQPVGDKSAMVQRVKTMQMGDLPDLDEIMRPAVEQLAARQDAKAKHMIIISDFDPSAPRADLIQKMKDNNIQCSTVAIGYGGHPIDEGKARWIANSTGGKFYSTQDYSELPQIFIKESMIVRRSLVQEIHFTPAMTNVPSTLVAGLGDGGIPALDGYVLTTAKPLAMIPLVRETDKGPDPILAHWQVGLGKTVAFTSGLWPKWGASWTDWPGFSKLWAQIARWASRPAASTALDVSTSVNGGKGRIRIEALDKDAAAINFLNIQGMLVDPRSAARPLQLTQIGPGRYEAEFDAQDSGSYVLNLSYQTNQGGKPVAGTLQTGVSVAYSTEFRQLETNDALLDQIATRTGGRVLALSEPKEAFDLAALPKAEKRTAIWEDLLRWTLLLFLLDVAVRRVAVNPLELVRKLRRRIAEAGDGRAAAEASAATLGSLKGASRQTRETIKTASDAGPAPERSAKYQPPAPDAKVSEQLSEALGGASEMDKPVVAKPTHKQPQPGEADFAARLKRAKQQAREKMDTDEPEQP